MSTCVVAYIDGGARGNPGPSGYGVRVETVEGKMVEELNGTIGVATNNVAEYHGLIAALTYLTAHDHRDVIIRSDSELLTRQMTGRYRVRNPVLKLLYAQAKELTAELARVRFEHVPRAQNARADELANAAMDAGKSDTDADSESIAFIRDKDLDNTGAVRPQTVGLVPNMPSGSGGIIGIGLDIEEISRVEKLLRHYGDRFLGRVFTDGEAAYSQRRRYPAQHLTGRFAAKEAAMKALGTGHSQGVLWQDIEVIRLGGPPQLKFHDGARRQFDRLGASTALVTISHSRTLAIAQVILLGR